jgi:peptidyl-prolyl cis-trans isomerase A (cyclophilin A)
VNGPSSLPDRYTIQFETTKGSFTVEVRRDLAPLGADRLHELVVTQFFDGVRFFRVIDGFMAQFGIAADPKVGDKWRTARIPDDTVAASNTRGWLTFANAGPGTRTTQLFINYRDNAQLDELGFAPLGEVVSGMDVVDRLYAGYGEGAPRGTGPRQDRVHAEGNTYLEREFPKLDYILSARISDPTEA